VFQLAEACLRELKEETGLDISLADCFNHAVSTLALWEASRLHSVFVHNVRKLLKFLALSAMGQFYRQHGMDEKIFCCMRQGCCPVWHCGSNRKEVGSPLHL